MYRSARYGKSYKQLNIRPKLSLPRLPSLSLLPHSSIFSPLSTKSTHPPHYTIMRSLLALTSTLCLTTLISAAPTLQARDVPTTEFLNVTYSSSAASHHNSSLPNVLILATGGTIAGASASQEDDTVSLIQLQRTSRGKQD
jgi:hypothetical protein